MLQPHCSGSMIVVSKPYICCAGTVPIAIRLRVIGQAELSAQRMGALDQGAPTFRMGFRKTAAARRKNNRRDAIGRNGWIVGMLHRAPKFIGIQ